MHLQKLILHRMLICSSGPHANAQTHYVYNELKMLERFGYVCGSSSHVNDMLHILKGNILKYICNFILLMQG